jgi:tetratricopeptide (TPR) repeat protein
MAKGKEISPDMVEKLADGSATMKQALGVSEADVYEIAAIGFNCYENNKLDDAQTIFEGLAALNPNDANAYTMLGSISQLKGQNEKAVEYYTKALELNDEDIAAHTNRGEILLTQGKLEEAGGDFARAIALDPDGEDRSANRARALVVVTSEILNEVKRAHDSGEIDKLMKS